MSVIVTPPNPANKVVINPPSGGNLVTVLAGTAGPAGPTGPTGPTGPANSLDVLSTTTGAAGSSANVVISGTAPSQSLAFTIPSGLKGDTGDTGATGAKGDTGNTGATGATPTLSVNSTVATLGYGNNGVASIGGTLPNNPKLYFTLPAGPTGSTGSTGNTGATPTLSVNSTVGTLVSGNTGIASIGGTLPNYPQLYLTLPAGPTGAGFDGITTSTSIAGGATQTTFTVNKLGALGVGSVVRISKTGGGNPFYFWFVGTVTGVNPSTPSITVAYTSNYAGGNTGIATTGPFTVAITGATGATGPQGPGVAYDQSLNTTDDVQFNSVKVSPTVNGTGTLIKQTYVNDSLSPFNGTYCLSFGGAQESLNIPVFTNKFAIGEFTADGTDLKWKGSPIGGGGGSSNQLTNGSYSVVLDSLGNTTFPNATVESSGLVVSQGVGSYDTIGVGSTGSLGYGLNNIALNPDGSASFANGAASIDSSGIFSSNGVELANIDRTYPLYQIQQSGATSGQIVRWNGSEWEPVTVTFGSGEFNQSLNTTDDVIFDKIYVGGSGSSDSVLKLGTLEFQPYGVNNVWFGDNVYYDGGNFRLRNTGSAGLFYFVGSAATSGPGEEGQFRLASSGQAGDAFSPTVQLKIGYTGEFGVGSALSYNPGDFSGANFYVDSVGNATLAGSITTSPKSAPSSPVAGQIYFDSGDSHFYGYNGTSWVQLDN